MIIDLTLIPHPGLKVPRAIEMDYQMSDGKLEIEVRAAVVGYLLQQWNVDCSPNASLDSRRHQLALKNHAALYAVDNLLLAPGFEGLS